MPKRLKSLPDDHHLFPIQAFFNSISPHRFVETIQSLLNGVGAGIDDAHCDFPGDLDPTEEPFEGVRFSLYEDTVVVDELTFERFLIEACKAHARERPDERARLEKILNSHGWVANLSG